MLRSIAPYLTVLAVLLVLDLLWIGVLAKSLYQQGIGHLMAAQPRLGVAVVFYLVFALGLTVFAVAPAGAADGWGMAALRGALLGLVAYATYDLTNLATLRQWPLQLALIDMAWGTGVSAVCAAVGRVVYERFGTG